MPTKDELKMFQEKKSEDTEEKNYNGGRTIAELRYWQSRPLKEKIQKTEETIENWVREFQKYTVRNFYTGVERTIICNGDDIYKKITKDEDIISCEPAVYVSFSGGKDSTVLLHIVRSMFPDIEAVFVDTGLEYPEIRQFVKSFDNVTIIRPKMSFVDVIKKYGYPLIGKEVAECIAQAKIALKTGKYNYRLLKLRGEAKDKNGNTSIFNKEKYAPLLDVDFNISNMCCNVMKKKPAHEYSKQSGKVPITAQTAEESHLRTEQWLRNGCNGFNMKNPISNPMSFWTEQDILLYIKENNLPIASVYGDIVYGSKTEQYAETLCDCGGKLCTTGCDRTGCIFCGFGAHLEKGESRFERLKKTHPRQYEYCIGGGDYDIECDIQIEEGKWRAYYMIDNYGRPWSKENKERFYNKHKDDKNYRFTKIWKPTKDGLGLGYVFDVLNGIYGKDFIRY